MANNKEKSSKELVVFVRVCPYNYSMNSIIIEYAKEHLSYNPKTGDLIWIKIPKRYNGKVCAVGKVAGNLSSSGYRDVTLLGKKLKAHRVAWALTYGAFPVGELDHIDGDRLNNAISNLRIVTHTQNQWNRRLSGSNTSGHKNVQWDSESNKWRVRVRVDGKRHHVGRFINKQDAINAAKEFMIKHHKEYARLNG